MKDKKRKKIIKKLEKMKVCNYQTICHEDIKGGTLTCFESLDNAFVYQCLYTGRENSCSHFEAIKETK